jgi:tetratricopeptide (TPR) repeat protein
MINYTLDKSFFLFILKKAILMEKDLAQEAIELALSGKWDKAVKINLVILEENLKDIEALNRLARAYSELGNISKARKAAKDVLKIDPFNTIANKALDKWKGLKRGETYKSGPSSAQSFLEEPGKTKIINLLHPGAPEIIAKLDSGDEVKLNTHSHKVSVCTKDGKYVGKLPDDLSARLRKLIKYGNAYKAYVKSVNKKEIRVFIRETMRVPKLADIPSFSTDKIDYISFTPPELVHKRGDVVTNVDSEED